MSDSSSPLMGMLVAPDGTITYDFNGNVHADAFILDETNAGFIGDKPTEVGEPGEEGDPRESPVTENVLWLDESGEIRERVTGYRYEFVGDPNREHVLEAYAETRIVASAGEELRVLLDALGRSSFVQAANEAVGFKIACGVCTFPFTGGEFSTFKTIEHGLDVVPIAVVCTPQDTSISPGVDNFAKKTFRVNGRYRNNVTGTGTGTWIAIGIKTE